MSDPYINEEYKNPNPIIPQTTDAEKLANELLQLQIDAEKIKLENEKRFQTLLNQFLGYGNA